MFDDKTEIKAEFGPDDLWDGWEDDFRKWYSDGKSDVYIRSRVIKHLERLFPDRKTSFTSHTWSIWLKLYEDFKRVIDEGHELSESWWLEKGQQGVEYLQGADNVRVDGRLYTWNMNNRFPGKYNESQSHIKVEGGMDAAPVEMRLQVTAEDAEDAYRTLVDQCRDKASTNGRGNTHPDK